MRVSLKKGVNAMLKNFQIDDHVKNKMTGEIKRYFQEERGEELGDLAALLILEFFAHKLAPHFYNNGVQDAHEFMSQRLEDIFELNK
jgi:uncharacterized protein (DUF2164 family)